MYVEVEICWIWWRLWRSGFEFTMEVKEPREPRLSIFQQASYVDESSLDTSFHERILRKIDEDRSKIGTKFTSTASCQKHLGSCRGYKSRVRWLQTTQFIEPWPSNKRTISAFQQFETMSLRFATLLLVAALAVTTNAAPFSTRALLQDACTRACAAARSTDPNTIQAIIDEGNNICNCRCNAEGWTPMHVSVESRCHVCIQVRLQIQSYNTQSCFVCRIWFLLHQAALEVLLTMLVILLCT